MLRKHFFKLMSSEIALRENGPTVTGTPTDRKDFARRIATMCETLGCSSHLHAFGQGLTDVREVNIENAHYFLLELDIVNRSLKITGYKLSAKARATTEYAQIERELISSAEHDAVLVSVDKIADLKRVYTNYYLDMNRFTQAVEEALGIKRRKAVQQKLDF